MSTGNKLEQIAIDLLILAALADLPELEELSEEIRELLANPLLFIQ